MVKPNSQRGPFGTWARKQRLTQEMSVQQVAQAVKADPSYVRRIEAGAQMPSIRLSMALEELFESIAPDIHEDLRAGIRELESESEERMHIALEMNGRLDSIEKALVRLAASVERIAEILSAGSQKGD